MRTANDAAPDHSAARYATELARIDRLSRLLDARFSFMGIRFGYDALLGLVPGLGDALAAAPSGWMIWRAWRLGLPHAVLVRMMANWGIDFAVGSVPLLGSVFDVAFKANLRNARLLRQVLEDRQAMALPRTLSAETLRP